MARIIPGVHYRCGCPVAVRFTCPTHKTHVATHIRFTYDTHGTGDGYIVRIESREARAFCATFSNGCDGVYVHHKKIGDVVRRATAAGLYVRCD